VCKVRLKRLTNTFLCAGVTAFFCGSTGNAQSAVTSANATVSPESLPVYSEMATASTVVRTLKKGDAVIVDFEIKTTEKWCSVRLVAQAVKLGFVQCQGLARQQQQFGNSGNSTVASPIGSRSAIKNLAVAPPPVHSADGYADLQREVVHDDAIDITKLADLESAAKNGSSMAMARAGLGHYAAGNFELERNSPDEAIEQYQAALNFAGRNPKLQTANLLSLAYVHLTRSEFSPALEYLDRARKIAPESAAVARFSGWAYYGLDRLPEATAEWQRAQKIEPSREIAAALEKVERDRATESGFSEGQADHFSIHYQGNATPQLATEILRTLEEHFRTLQAQLHFAPAEPIAVVLYTQETFRDITRAPGWAVGLNDGRIRVPIRGLTSVTDDLSRELMHELTHSFIQQKAQGRCPQWLNEGLAQYMEGRRSDNTASALIAVYERETYIPLHKLEGSWGKFPAAAAAFSYAWSLAATETLIADSGMYGLARFFEHFSNETAVEPALREAFQTDYAGLERNTIEYLRRTYPQ
jgi:predicted negative regulator of RcsB-dependent stress response